MIARKLLILLLFFAAFQTSQANWIKQNSNTLAWLRDVYFLNEQIGWVVGSGGTYLKTNDGGKSWTKEKNFTGDTIRQVYFTGEQTGWLLCERDQYTRAPIRRLMCWKLRTAVLTGNAPNLPTAGESASLNYFLPKTAPALQSAKTARFFR
jgi:hypothetical protein